MKLRTNVASFEHSVNIHAKEECSGNSREPSLPPWLRHIYSILTFVVIKLPLNSSFHAHLEFYSLHRHHRLRHSEIIMHHNNRYDIHPRISAWLKAIKMKWIVKMLGIRWEQAGDGNILHVCIWSLSKIHFYWIFSHCKFFTTHAPHIKHSRKHNVQHPSHLISCIRPKTYGHLRHFKSKQFLSCDWDKWQGCTNAQNPFDEHSICYLHGYRRLSHGKIRSLHEFYGGDPTQLFTRYQPTIPYSIQ